MDIHVGKFSLQQVNCQTCAKSLFLSLVSQRVQELGDIDFAVKDTTLHITSITKFDIEELFGASNHIGKCGRIPVCIFE